MNGKEEKNAIVEQKKVDIFTDEYRKSLLDKRKYYSEHPEEAKKHIGKKYDGH